VRREESSRRAKYSRISISAKHATQTNVSPIIDWSAAEVYLYLLARNLLLNDGYRRGFARVGCTVCPFGSQWGEYLAWKVAPNDIEPLLKTLVNYGKRVTGTEAAALTFVSKGEWKMRSGGRHLPAGGSRVAATVKSHEITFSIRHPTTPLWSWMKTMGKITSDTQSSAVLETSRGLFRVQTKQYEQGIRVNISGSGLDRFTVRDFRSIAYKTAYCVLCNACQAECPSGALAIDGTVRIDTYRCVHCGACLTLVDKGCWAAKSLDVTEQGVGMKGMGAYQTFGMRQAWLSEFFSDPQRWWVENSLGNRQFDSMRAWLPQAGIIDSTTRELTPVGRELCRLSANSPITWLSIWVNLAMQSPLVKWFVQSVRFDVSLSRQDLLEMMPEQLSKRTRSNALLSLVQLLDLTPLGHDLHLAQVFRKGRKLQGIMRRPIDRLPLIALLYALYRLAAEDGRTAFRLSELCTESGPLYQLFGIEETRLIFLLRGAGEQYPQFIQVELVRDLDNIYLSQDVSLEEILQYA